VPAPEPTVVEFDTLRAEQKTGETGDPVVGGPIVTGGARYCVDHDNVVMLIEWSQ
jgi:hypothetical protein